MNAELAFLAAIVESSDDAIIGITPAGRIASWNSGARTIYGYTAGEALGRPVAMLALPERQDEIALLQVRLHRGERIEHFQTLHLTKNGQTLIISMTVSPVIDSAGRLLGASLLCRDMTERLQAEDAVREAEGKYRSIFTAETDAILLLDMATGRLVDFNAAALTLYGYDRDTFARLSLQDLFPNVPGEEGSSLSPAAGNRFATDLHRRRDGSTFAAEMSTSSFVWQRRTILVGIVRDITERLRSQQLWHSLAIAKGIQQHLLPQQAPPVPGLDIHAHSFSCEEVGGDYYDFFLLPGPQQPLLGFAIGDISGHGIGAALLMAMAKGMLHGEVPNCGCQLEQIFARMNRHLLGAIEDSSFMTLFLGLFEPATRTMRWNSAGHGPVLWYRSCQGIIAELLPTAAPLSVDPAAAYAPAPPIVLEAGDILLLGTDGIWEARNPCGEMFGLARLRQLIATLALKGAESIHDAIIAKVHEFMAGSPPVDDMTLMVIKVTEAPDRIPASRRP
jgi:sigma-B regulation protein RsbU (phosphoserine phosphatase)